MHNLFKLDGNVIVVTGATGVLAGGVAKYLLECGSKVVFLSRDPVKVAAAVEGAQSISSDVLGIACDVTEREELILAKEKIVDALGCVDGLVNGAGGNVPGATVGPEDCLFDLDVDEYMKAIDLNLKGTVLPSLVFGEAMAESGSGSIVNFSSMASAQSITRVLGYSNAKAAVDSFTRWMALELAKRYGDGMRMNAVAPGFFMGKQNRALLQNEDGSLTERGRRVVENTPMGRFGATKEIFGLIHYFLSDASSFTTGTVVPVDGGFSSFSGV